MLKPAISYVVRTLSRLATNGPMFLRLVVAFVFDAIDDRRNIKTRHGSFTIRVGNPIERWRADTLLTKEPETIAWLERTLTSESVLIDIGANIGIYTLYAEHMFDGGIDTVCFEPESMNFARLNQNISDNGYSARTICLPIGLGNKRAVSFFRLSGLGAGRALHGDRHVSTADTGYRQGIVIDRLDDVLSALTEIREPTHLKVDVDGPEIDILRGAFATLRSKSLRHILIELTDDEVPIAKGILEPVGFSNVLHGDSIDGMANYIFERKEKEMLG